jgi:hypothetical protein
MTSISIWSVLRVVVLPSSGLCKLLAHEGFRVLPTSRELRLDGVRPVASVFDGLARRADLESEHERRNAPVTTPNTPDTIVDHDTPSIGFAVAVLVMLSAFQRTESPVISDGNNFACASVWRETMTPIEFADILATICERAVVRVVAPFEMRLANASR